MLKPKLSKFVNNQYKALRYMVTKIVCYKKAIKFKLILMLKNNFDWLIKRRVKLNFVNCR